MCSRTRWVVVSAVAALVVAGGWLASHARAAAPGSTTGKYGHAVLFNGASSLARIADLHLSHGVTVKAYHLRSRARDSQTLIPKTRSDGGFPYRVALSRGRARGFVRAGGRTARGHDAAAPSPAPSPTPSPSPAPTPSATSRNVEVTYYGAYDNDPSGSLAIAHPVMHAQAGGTGTYADPLTFASPAGTGAYPWGTLIYVPRVQKYFIREDECATSWTAPDGCGPVSHVDLYVGNPSDSSAVVACENALTTDENQTIIVDPPSNLSVDHTPIWNQATRTCMTPHSATPTPSP